MPSHAAATSARPRVVAGLRLLRPVGRGAEGEVWEARGSAGERRALKLIRPDALVDPEQVEARGRLLLRVDHPALVRVHRVGVLSGGNLDGWGFVDMDFVDGASLAGAGEEPDALERLRPLAEALDALHRGVWSGGVPLVHRDIKPANLIGTPSGLVLVDHSTLRSADGDTLTRIGTPVFAAPEVVTGRIGPPADVYSFAATAVALLTGLRGDALAEVLDHPDRHDLPDGIRAALAATPSHRPASPLAVVEPGTIRLTDDAAHDGWDEGAPAAAERWLTWAALRRTWARTLLTGGVVALAAAVAAGWLAGAVGIAPPSPELHAGGVAGGIALLAGAVVTVRRGGVLARVLLLPLWAIGAAALVAGASIAALPLVAAGKGGALLRGLVRLLAGPVVALAPGRRRAGHNAVPGVDEELA